MRGHPISMDLGTGTVEGQGALAGSDGFLGYRSRHLSVKATPTSVLPFCSLSLRQAGLASCSVLSLPRCLALPLKKGDQTLRQICSLWPHWKVTSMGQGLPACELRRGSNPQASHMSQSHHW